MWYPSLISAFFSICTPFNLPKTTYIPATVLPNFKYQLQFSGNVLHREVTGYEKIRQFLNGLYGGRGPKGEAPFDVTHGYYIERGPILQPTRLLSTEELDFYAQQYARNGLHGPTNWYRNGEYNFRDEEEMAKRIEKEGYEFQMPVLFVAGKRDAALPPAMSRGMEKNFRSLTRGEVDASHWALWEKPTEVNQLIKEWLVGQIASKANL
jgi:soluble epoxide hydrolase/lipid-phosphate phosphatase